MKKIIALLVAAVLLCGLAFASDKYDLDNFGYRTVRTRGRGNLVFQSKPRGSFMSEYSFSNGDRIYVNLDWREDGYAIAYKNGDYGYVDASYIDWGSDSSDSIHDLDNFVWHTVRIKNGGALVFQRTPRGAFMYSHQFYDGDEVFVNEYYREDGYALAYEDGSYGYVDAGYIDWSYDDDYDDDVHDLDNFDYRYVDIDNGGALVFQKTAGGAFMSKYKYYDGDRIFVNVDYRERGYALAYKSGVYGYVDARYIDW